MLDRVDAGHRPLLHDAFQKGEARRAAALEAAALPEPGIIGVAVGGIGFAVAHIGAPDEPPPETLDHLLAGQPRPARGRIAFIDHLTEDPRLSREVAVQPGADIVDDRGAAPAAGLGARTRVVYGTGVAVR